MNVLCFGVLKVSKTMVGSGLVVIDKSENYHQRPFRPTLHRLELHQFVFVTSKPSYALISIFLGEYHALMDASFMFGEFHASKRPFAIVLSST